MDKISISALTDTIIILFMICGPPLLFLLIIYVVMANVYFNIENIPMEWSNDITGGIPENQLILYGISAFIFIILIGIGIYIELKQSYKIKN